MLATIALAAGRATSSAHPQPEPDRNDRYVKLTPAADRVRVAYTIYLGDQPGARARLRLDRNHDGQVDDTEAAVLGKELADLVEPAVTLLVDGAPTKIGWSTISVGLGTPDTAAGSLSVDLVGWACTTNAAHHRLALRDHVHVDTPGQLELRLEEGPGVRFGDRRLAGEPMSDLVATWRADEGRLAAGLDADYAVDPALAGRPGDQRCSASGTAAGGHRRPLVYALAALTGVALAFVTVVLTRRRPAPPVRT